MAANTAPIYTKTPIISTDGTNSTSSPLGPTFTTAAADYDGSTATHNKIVFTASSTDGSYVQRLRFKAKGTNVQTVARIYLNNGGAATTAANNVFIDEVTLPATTASTNANTTAVDVWVDLILPANCRILVGLGTTVAAGWVCQALRGGNY